MFVFRKSYTNRDECRTILFEETRIVYRWNLVEDKDMPEELRNIDLETVPATYKISLI